MFLSPKDPAFGVTHPLGLPRPVDPDNLFGARTVFFARNAMPIPTGCLAHFDAAVYRPYVRRIVLILNQMEFGWSGPAMIDGPPRYCLLLDGEPACVPHDLRPLIPEPPRVSLEALLEHFDSRHRTVPALQLLDVLALASEDILGARFSKAAAERPWVGEFMR